MKVKIILMGGGKKPEYKSAGAAGADLYAAHAAELTPGQRKHIATGVKLEIPEGYEGQIRSRSGLANETGVIVFNQPSTIDSDFRGEIEVLLWNSSQRKVEIKRGERVAQIVFAPVARAEFATADELSETARGEKGWGSTGKTDDEGPSVGDDGFTIGGVDDEVPPVPLASPASPEVTRRALMICAGYQATISHVLDPKDVGLLGFDPEYGFGYLYSGKQNVYLEPTEENMKKIVEETSKRVLSNAEFKKKVQSEGPDFFMAKRMMMHFMSHAAGMAHQGECEVSRRVPGMLKEAYEAKISERREQIRSELMAVSGLLMMSKPGGMYLSVGEDLIRTPEGDFEYNYDSIVSFYRFVLRNIEVDMSDNNVVNALVPMRMSIWQELAGAGVFG